MAQIMREKHVSYIRDRRVHTYQVGAHFEALDEGVLMASLDPRYYTQVGFNYISVQV